jgi:eukaryotic-like serine/threonine-protein kinase
MEHPNIATVFDAGATETGRPYFVMELVKGLPITQYCNDRQLSTQDRLELFLQVCDAVQHAHQKGVIHRDLKPSNVLITERDGRPVPKVIDFGVAKATQTRLTDKIFVTHLHQWLGTPAYMSPEQAGSSTLDVDARTDVYSLGALLYELLAGKPPFDPQSLMAAGLEGMCRIIREETPPRLSTRRRQNLVTDKTEVQVPESRIAQDLESIVMKALEKDRGRRYSSALSLAQDIERHLNSEAVLATPGASQCRTGS